MLGPEAPPASLTDEDAVEALDEARRRTLALVRVGVRRGPRARALAADEPAGVGSRPHRRVRGSVAGAPLRRAPDAARAHWPTSTTRSRRRAPTAATCPSWARREAREYLAEIRGTQPRGDRRAGRRRRHHPRADHPPRASAQRDDAADAAAGPPRRPAVRRGPAGGNGADPRRRVAAHRARAGRGPRGRVHARRARRTASPTTTSARVIAPMSAAYLIGRTPITNATYLTFVEGGGYERREWWSDEGWSWKEDYDITRPGGWTADLSAEWRLTQLVPLDPDRPVVHISWFEADAFARAHGLRLPTEAEWEKAATWDQETGTARRQPWGEDPPVPGVHANVDQLARRPRPGRRLPRRRLAVRLPGHDRRRLGVDEQRVRRLPRLRRLSVPRVLGGVLRLRIPGTARRLVGHAAARLHARRSATGTSPSAARSSPACEWPATCEPTMKSVQLNNRVQVDSWLTEDDERSLANDVLDGLTKPFKELAPKHFYDARGSELFERICELPEYYPTRTELADPRRPRRRHRGRHRRRRAGRARAPGPRTRPESCSTRWRPPARCGATSRSTCRPASSRTPPTG